ncbi:hypothetical protein BU26DRAFT_66210 [Trematosphaeria pertusa]|uniref:Uncharacterized protein n=1 Tax=Trematosphaeria pertusa TaxID=390896 RepID=A0A6A6I8T2_9PLEO|nr:uncharacterized protein BU26DRAFT_66210 [Trematosphaeria pertusa]KAF2246352.1 hypothetical protein BU26DRAFT_66210 [Trematosphaeria pertusa]
MCWISVGRSFWRIYCASSLYMDELLAFGATYLIALLAKAKRGDGSSRQSKRLSGTSHDVFLRAELNGSNDYLPGAFLFLFLASVSMDCGDMG